MNKSIQMMLVAGILIVTVLLLSCARTSPGEGSPAVSEGEISTAVDDVNDLNVLNTDLDNDVDFQVLEDVPLE